MTPRGGPLDEKFFRAFMEGCLWIFIGVAAVAVLLGLFGLMPP